MTDYVVSSGVTSSGLTLVDGDTMRVLAGGSAVRITANSGSRIFNDGSTSGVTLNSGIEDVRDGGVATLTTVNSGGVDNVLFGGVTSLTTVNSLGVEDVRDGGVTSYTTVYGGGTENVHNGGTSINTTILGGGVENVDRGGVASVTTVQSGGLEEVRNGGVTSATSLFRGGTEDVLAGGVASATTVFGGGTETVSGSLGAGNGYTIDTVVSSGGTENVLSGGWARDTILNGGGTVDVASGGIAENMSVTSAAANVLDNGVLVYNGGAEQTHSFGGTLTGSGAIGEFGPSTLVLGGNASGFTGVVSVTDGTVELTSATAAGSASIDFGRFVGLTEAGTLQVDGTNTPGNTISGFAVGDKIDLRNQDITSASLGTNNLLTLTVSGGGTETLQFNQTQDFAGMRFAVSADGHGGTDISLERAPLTGVGSGLLGNFIAQQESAILQDIAAVGGDLGAQGGASIPLEPLRPANPGGLFGDLLNGNQAPGLAALLGQG